MGSESDKSVYRILDELPKPTSATFLSNGAIRLGLSVTNHNENVSQQVYKDIAVFKSGIISTLSRGLDDVVASLESPSGSRTAILREGNDKKRRVEIWQDERQIVTHDVTDVHGPFYSDPHYGSLSFSPSETSIVYTAEANARESEQFRYVPPLGEGFGRKKRPTLFILRFPASGTISLTSLDELELGNNRAYLGQAEFLEEDFLKASAYTTTSDDRLLGIRGCTNRPAYIVLLRIYDDNSLSGTSCDIQAISSSHLSSRSPRITGQGSRQQICWLSNNKGGPHASCASILVYDRANSTTETLVNEIATAKEQGGFPGIFTDFALAKQPFITIDGETYLLVHSAWGSRMTILAVSLTSGGVTELTPDKKGELWSWRLFATDGKNRFVCSRSNPKEPWEVFLGTTDGKNVLEWVSLYKSKPSPKVKAALDGLDAQIVKIPGREPTETIVLQPPRNEAGAIPPCITAAHGGPHFHITTEFDPQFAAHCIEGFTISFPNYTGSVGFGQTAITSLLGKAGTLDVQDCLASVQHLIKLGIAANDPKKQIIFGGSHGGFIAAHMVGQYPGAFGAAVMRNPVINAGELATTDIPDWYFQEFGLNYSPKSVVTPEVYAKLFAASPIAHVENVKTPVLLLVGDSDQRVAPTQAKGFYHALKAQGSTVDMIVFPDESHPLGGIKAGRVIWDTCRNWFNQFTPVDL